MESRDLRRWTIADEDTDGKLNKLEFRNFLHPEEADHMKDIVVQVQQGSLRLLWTSTNQKWTRSYRNIFSVEFYATLEF